MTSSPTPTRQLAIRSATKADFDQIVALLDRWWGGPSPERAHPLFFHEFGETALVAEDEGLLVGFLLGLYTRSQPGTGYIHLVGIHPDHRRRGVGHDLYSAFCDQARAAGMARVKAIAAVGHEGPTRFHVALGFKGVEDPHYAGKGRARMVFIKDL
jgi:N-acetylglutamate synthase-like GNAT family acetyltransferase